MARKRFSNRKLVEVFAGKLGSTPEIEGLWHVWLDLDALKLNFRQAAKNKSRRSVDGPILVDYVAASPAQANNAKALFEHSNLVRRFKAT
jgi:hypothetical protein